MNVSREDVKAYVASRPWTEDGIEGDGPMHLAEDLNEFLDWNEANGEKAFKPATDKDIRRYVGSCRKVIRAYDAHESAMDLLRRNIDDQFIKDCLRQNEALTTSWIGN